MEMIRTPEDRFANLPGFAYEPRYMDINGARLHYVDEGQGEVILCLHGEPTWSYLYRHMIGPLSGKHRVLAPDWFGFGRSDKYTNPEMYTFQMHYNTLVWFCEELGLNNITLVAQDWGGMLGLRMLGEMPERFARIVLMNTGPATGETPLGPGFQQWFEYIQRTKELDVRKLMERALMRETSKTPEVLDAYDAPFPDATYKQGAHRFPYLVPQKPDDPGAAEMRTARKILANWTKPALLMFGDMDPVLGVPVGKALAKLIPSVDACMVIEGAGHFIQEDAGQRLADEILKFMAG